MFIVLCKKWKRKCDDGEACNHCKISGKDCVRLPVFNNKQINVISDIFLNEQMEREERIRITLELVKTWMGNEEEGDKNDDNVL